MGFCVLDVELITRAGTVVLPRTHIDILEGPESSNLLYLGQVEERRLSLKTFAEQLEEVARRGSGPGTKRRVWIPPLEKSAEAKQDEAPEEGCSRGCPCKAKKEKVEKKDPPTKLREVWDEGSCFLGQKGWSSLTYVPYVLEPLADDCYVTTAALFGSEEQINDDVPEGGVMILDVDPTIQNWLGLKKQPGRYFKKIKADLRVLPDENRDTISRLTLLKGVMFKVVQSRRPAIVIGRRQCGMLLERRDEALDMASAGDIDHEAIGHRLDEMLDAARLEGMSEEGLAEAEKLVKHRFYNIWRMKLRWGDVADLPAFKIELKEGEVFELPRPYRRRYTPAETRWWNTRIKELCDIGVLRRSDSGQLSPSNLLPKKREGIVLLDDFRMIIDLRGVNQRTKPMHYGLPKLDTVVHHLSGSDCFGKGDKVSGYWQVNLDENSRKLTAFDCPAGAYEHCRMPQGHCNAVPWFQRVFEGVLGPLLWTKVLQYLDDSLLHAKGEQAYLKVLVEYFELLDKHNIKLHPAKFTLFARALTWCGKMMSKNGLRPVPHRTDSVKAMPDPDLLSEMMNFVYGTAWFRGHIIHFARIAAPLYDLWKDTLEPYKRKTMQVAKKFKLSDLPGWEEKGKAAFENLKQALVEAIETSLLL